MKLTNKYGYSLYEQNFDAWGRKRNPNTWSYENIPVTYALQNKFAHDFLLKGQAKWFRVLDIEPTTYWYFGSGYGNGLW